jgi:hypothetical protein
VYLLFSGTTISVTCSECVFVSLRYASCKAHAPCYIVIFGLSGCTTSSHIISNGTIFGGRGGGIMEHKMCVVIFCRILLETFFILRRTERDMTMNVVSM